MQFEEDKETVPPAMTDDDFRPFPANKHFKSEPVTSEEQRKMVWDYIMVRGLSVREVSAMMGIEMSRVGAIVRLQELEKSWVKQGKTLAKPYARAINATIPQGRMNKPFESINDLPVHKATEQQIFWPASEARHFTREDAAKVFADGLLPADKRVPHPEVIQQLKERNAGIPPQERAQLAAARARAENEKKAAAVERRMKKEAAAIKVVEGARWDFKFRDIKVDDAGPTGRDLKGTGWRYGAPHRDRIRGEIKIPTRV